MSYNYYQLISKDNNREEVILGSKDEDKVQMAFFREFRKIVETRPKDGTLVVNNYSCDFGNGKGLYIRAL